MKKMLQALSCTMFIITAIEYFSKKADERAEFQNVLKILFVAMFSVL